MFYEVDRDALTLLRAAKEHHERLEPREPFSDGTRVAPVLASCGARGSKARDAPLREDCEVPGDRGALVWEERLGSIPGLDIYRVARCGLEMRRAS